jgi:hypothetical protein
MIHKTGLKMVREISEGRGKEAEMEIIILYQITPGLKGLTPHQVQLKVSSSTEGLKVQLKV